jgi:hypothetical protein
MDHNAKTNLDQEIMWISGHSVLCLYKGFSLACELVQKWEWKFAIKGFTIDEALSLGLEEK